MKKLMMLAIFAMLSMASASFATEMKGETIHVGVNGMVCDFCAQSLKKVFLKQEAVKDIDVSLEKKLITIDTKPGKTLDDKVIDQLVVDAGYAVEKIHHMKAE